MTTGMSFEVYMKGLVYTVLLALFAYPFLSFIIRKYVCGKWKVRLLFLLFILIGIAFFCPLFSNPSTLLLVGCSAISYCLFHGIADLFSKMKTVGKVLVEFLLSFILFLFPLIVFALVGHFRMTQTILQKFPDGSYTFFPGYWDDIVQTSLILSVILITAKYVYGYGLEKQEKIKQRKVRESRLHEELLQAQLDALYARINPHFLYNSLNSIAGLALVDGDKTRQMALALSRFFRYSVDKRSSHLVSLEEEMEMVHTYLEIEKIRFGNRLDFKIELSANCQKSRVPRLLLQPLVENCIRHGWKGDLEIFRIRISICIRNSALQISVEDNGLPFPDDFVPGYGLKNVSDKLELLFPGKTHLELLNAPVKKVRITLPVRIE